MRFRSAGNEHTSNGFVRGVCGAGSQKLVEHAAGACVVVFRQQASERKKIRNGFHVSSCHFRQPILDSGNQHTKILIEHHASAPHIALRPDRDNTVLTFWRP